MGIGVRRRVRRTGGQLVRRFGLLPGGDPDGLGEDDRLRGRSLPYVILVYFADTRTNLYQLRQWYAPLRELHARHPVGIVCLDSRTAAQLREETDFDVLCVGRIGTLDDLVARSDIAVCLYVNHNVRNFHPLRFPTMLHAYLGHGESDKVASASNQVKAYDFVLLAGQTARDRLARALLRYDADRHVRLIGRPQLDAPPTEPAARAATGGRVTVRYAPTWEGAQPSMAYGSVASHGVGIVQALLADGGFRVIYRPHPRTGANDGDYAAADRAIRALVTRAGESSGAGHLVDTSPDWHAREDGADVLISDISAVAADWMITDKPLLVTEPTSPQAMVDADAVLSASRRLAAADVDRTPDLVRAALAEPVDAQRTAWRERTFGDTAPGAATGRFLDVVSELVAIRNSEVRQSTGTVERRGDSRAVDAADPTPDRPQ